RAGLGIAVFTLLSPHKHGSGLGNTILPLLSLSHTRTHIYIHSSGLGNTVLPLLSHSHTHASPHLQAGQSRAHTHPPIFTGLD
ncbi:unnamed protein product, partial [Gulo gulo]